LPQQPPSYLLCQSWRARVPVRSTRVCHAAHTARSSQSSSRADACTSVAAAHTALASASFAVARRSVSSTRSTAPLLFFAFSLAVTEGEEKACVFQMMPLRGALSHAPVPACRRPAHPRLFRSFRTIAMRQAAAALMAACGSRRAPRCGANDRRSILHTKKLFVCNVTQRDWSTLYAS
jgi:hypothetical protein